MGKNSRVIRYYIVIIALFGLLGISLLTGCKGTPDVLEEVPWVKVQSIKSCRLNQESKYSGEVRGRNESQLSFQVGGRIVKRYIDRGSTVKTGQILMEISPADLQQSLISQRAQVVAAQAQLRLAQNNYDRFRNLLKEQVISQAEFDQYRAARDSAVAGVDQAKAIYRATANQLNYANLVAHSSGVVEEVMGEVGQVISPGQPVITLVQNQEKEIEIDVPENKVDELKKNKKITVAFWALPEVKVNGIIREISPMADSITRTYKVRISLLNPPLDVKLGMTAEVVLEKSEDKEEVFIPLSAIYQSGNVPSVWIVKNGKVELANVELGQFADDKIQVLQGLKEGDMVVVAGVHKLRSGQKIRFVGGETQ